MKSKSQRRYFKSLQYLCLEQQWRRRHFESRNTESECTRHQFVANGDVNRDLLASIQLSKSRSDAGSETSGFANSSVESLNSLGMVNYCDNSENLLSNSNVES